MGIALLAQPAQPRTMRGAIVAGVEEFKTSDGVVKIGIIRHAGMMIEAGGRGQDHHSGEGPGER